jgi:hypothetical protein
MTILPILPFVAGAALACIPLVPTSPSTAAHPHYPKATTVAGVKGNVTVSWFTVPFNPDQVKKVGANYLWNRGFSLKTDVALECGDVKVTPGTYALGFKMDSKGEKWSVVIMPREISRLNRQLSRVKRSGGDTSEIEGKLQALAKKGIRNMTLPTTTFKGKAAEHMTIYSVNYGYKTSGRRSPDPISGVEAEYRVSFGDLHIKFAFSEVFQAKKGDTPKPGK